MFTHGTVPKTVFDAPIAYATGLQELVLPGRHLLHQGLELLLEAANEEPAEGVIGIAIDYRMLVGASFDFILCNVGEGYAGDLLPSPHEISLVAL
ncbi:hypothetical protein EN801_046620, partial [Mesorhizobium sp. M00.F.Ca.ET.158.01.1.1]